MAIGHDRGRQFVSQLGAVAERQGFEPWIRFWRILTFQASAFDHSATAPHALEGERPSGMRGVPQAGYS